MIRILFIIAVLILVIGTMRHINKQPPAQRKKLWRHVIITGVVITLLLLTITGKLHWIGVAIAAVIPLLKQLITVGIRLFPFLKNPTVQKWFKKNTPPQTGANTFFEAYLDEKGEMGAKITQGEWTGRQLKELTEQELTTFYRYCQNDLHAQQFLAAYLEKYYPHLTDFQQHPAQQTSMDEAQALDVLGLKPGASEKEIHQAHKRLIQKMHPDRGGSDFLAAQINLAKKVLMENKKG
ncbi:J domain-containing protein [Marinibactrum halimedae]|uniref:J domain-containing protein n=1 Tax=Marinibactrum halimedae TaxID=1444977 RepID=A0AA37T6F9_9GAMM|nr:DnaJ domain-containing protein [Marinibactrum halimedae]MCD9460639.1 DnaJ domain-containing protein [Marinibactrum halimedae]GLS27855.1 hypothetical protein GCM10007877_35740 [Marinibactrum halimedae]